MLMKLSSVQKINSQSNQTNIGGPAMAVRELTEEQLAKMNEEMFKKVQMWGEDVIVY